MKQEYRHIIKYKHLNINKKQFTINYRYTIHVAIEYYTIISIGTSF